MKLHCPTPEEADQLMRGVTDWRGWSVCAGGLPPAQLFRRAIDRGVGTWQMPRLFCDEATGRVVGAGGFKSEPCERSIEIGYGVAPECWGRGHATEGVTLLCAEAFSSGLIDEIRAETLPTNAASMKVLQKTGFACYGTGMGNEGPVRLWRKFADESPVAFP